MWNDPHVVISGYRKYYKYYNNKVELLYIVENGQRKEKGREEKGREERQRVEIRREWGRREKREGGGGRDGSKYTCILF